MSSADMPQFRSAGQDPAAPRPEVEEPPRFARLKAVTIGILVVDLVSWVMDIVARMTGAMNDALLSTVNSVPGSESFSDAEKQRIVESSGGLSIPQAAFQLILTLGVFALVYLGLRAHKNWARIVGIVLAFVAIGGSLFANVAAIALNVQMGAIGIVSMLLTVVALALLVYWLVLAFSREVRLFLAPSRAA